MTKKLIITFSVFTLIFASYGRDNADTFDYGVVINDVRWATRNADVNRTFAPTPESSGAFFQWNRKKGWSATDTEVEGWDSFLSEGKEWERTNDPCPAGWRVPTEEELRSLFHSTITFAGNWDDWDAWTDADEDAYANYISSRHWISNWQNTGVSGMLFGTAPNQIFLPAAGWRYTAGTLLTAGASGNYWSSTQNGSPIAWSLWFNSGISLVTNWNRAFGLSVRCVAE